MLPVIVAEARLCQGDFAGAEAAVSGAFSGQSPRLQRLAACVLAKAQLKQGNGVRALETIERTLSTKTSNGLESDIDLLTLRAEARLACGDADGARAAIAEARALIDRIAAGIDDALLQTSFVTRVEPCARAIGLCDAWSVDA
jgi:Flp pilus assembly protein TadD